MKKLWNAIRKMLWRRHETISMTITMPRHPFIEGEYALLLDRTIKLPPKWSIEIGLEVGETSHELGSFADVIVRDPEGNVREKLKGRIGRIAHIRPSGESN